ncbi:Ig-like domain-containing protein [uncultured Albimonas sp.]|uniref:Ig-like domain-containing protein n=1 Tax=uncultured Albimonas sp. TaxID=1331701 RepID=UPI0030EBCFA1|tara:strand:+ start:1769 stop:3805 length:2037 start_codon:yes stop_codon:yes gene_type:complete
MTQAISGALTGTPGDDTLLGEGLRDTLFGGAGDDVLTLAGPGGAAWGGEGDDRLISGGPLRDFLWGGAGNDVFELDGMVYAFGGEGDDVFRLTGDTSAALVVGGAGVDVLELEGPAARYAVRDGTLTRDGVAVADLAGIEILRFEDREAAVADLQPSSVRSEPLGGGGEAITASGPALVLRGTGAADRIVAWGGDASVRAGAGDDVVRIDGAGSHQVRGGAGDDLIEALGWDVQVDAGRGNDTIAGGFGVQTVDGGAGKDVVDYGLRSMDEFAIEILGPGQARVVRLPTTVDGVAHQWDEISRVEVLRFADGKIRLTGAPVADAEHFAMREGETLRIAVAELLDGDVDPTGGALRLTGVGAAQGGIVTLEGDEVVFAPLPGFHGAASFDYVVEGAAGSATQRTSVEVASTNAAPVAADDAFSGGTGGRLRGNLLADNGAGPDSDPDGDALRVTNVGGVALPERRAAEIALDDGVSLRVWADGRVAWDFSHAFPGLGMGETASVSVTYVLSDPEGAVSLGRAMATVTGGEGALRLQGGPGEDALAGAAGDDRLAGRGGDDLLRGFGGDDRLNGGAGDDAVRGGAGDDRLRGAAGDDRLTGGGGADLFVFRPGDGDDVITDFDPTQDRLTVRGLDEEDGLVTLDLGRDLLILGADLSIRIVGGGEGDGGHAWTGDWDLLA